MPHPRTLRPEQTALIVIDIQEAFRDSIRRFDRMVRQASIAVRGFQILGLPVIVTEQYPKGLGHTVAELQQALGQSAAVIDKTAFSSCGAGSFIERLDATGAKQVVLCGLETHVCVNQTCHDLIDRGYQVHILTDAVGSRSKQNRKSGLEKMFTSGAVPSNVEMALFELMADSKHPKFKEVQSLLR